MVDEWKARFEIAGVFEPDTDIQLTPMVLIKRSESQELIVDKLMPIHEALVSISSNEFKNAKEYDITKFGTNKFAQESEIGVAERHLALALSLYTVKTGYPTRILRKGVAWNLRYLEKSRMASSIPGIQFRKTQLSQDAKTKLRVKTNEFVTEFPKYEEMTENIRSFTSLAARYYWMARSISQDQAAFLNHVIALEVLLSHKVTPTSLIRHRAALVLGKDDSNELLIYRKMGKVYDARNRIVHSGEDTIDYDLINFLEDTVPRLIEGMVKLSKALPGDAGKNKTAICKALDDARMNRKLLGHIRASLNML